MAFYAPSSARALVRARPCRAGIIALGVRRNLGARVCLLIAPLGLLGQLGPLGVLLRHRSAGIASLRRLAFPFFLAVSLPEWLKIPHPSSRALIVRGRLCRREKKRKLPLWDGLGTTCIRHVASDSNVLAFLSYCQKNGGAIPFLPVLRKPGFAVICLAKRPVCGQQTGPGSVCEWDVRKRFFFAAGAPVFPMAFSVEEQSPGCSFPFS